MAKRLSQQLAELSVRAKNAEDAVAAAANEAHGKIETRKEQARAAAAKATEKVSREIESARAIQPFGTGPQCEQKSRATWTP